MEEEIICPEILLSAYSRGYFPMADEFDGKIWWHSPDPRAIIPLDNIKPPRTLIQFLKKNNFEFKVDSNFEYVINKCASRPKTWISQSLIDAFIEFHYQGYAHSVETYLDGKIVGGLYGVTIGACFSGESMFADVSNASKAAFYYLAYRLIERGFILLDSQYKNEFTKRLGAIEIPKLIYLNLLERAKQLPCIL